MNNIFFAYEVNRVSKFFIHVKRSLWKCLTHFSFSSLEFFFLEYAKLTVIVFWIAIRNILSFCILCVSVGVLLTQFFEKGDQTIGHILGSTLKLTVFDLNPNVNFRLCYLIKITSKKLCKNM